MLLLVVAGCLAYANSLSGPFIFDDALSVTSNERIGHLWPLWDALNPERELPLAGRPLAQLSFALNYAAGGLDVHGYHAVNVGLHIGCALLLFGIVRRTLDLPRFTRGFLRQSTPLALAAALLWLVHPLNTDAVDYVTQRTELLMGLFYLGTMYCAIRAFESGSATRWQILAGSACAAGMACKESMATVPLMVVLYDRVFLFESMSRAWRSRRRLYVGLACGWVVLVALIWSAPRTNSAGFSVGISPWTYLLNQTTMIVQYLKLSIWPRDLVLHYGFPRAYTLVDVWPSFLAVASVAIATIAALIVRPALGFLGAWFFMTLAPTSSIVPIFTEVGAERRMYLPLMAVVVLAIVGLQWSWQRIPPSRSSSVQASRAGDLAILPVSVALSLVLMAGTIARNRDYESALTIAQTSLARWPTGHNHHALGLELIAVGRYDEGLMHLREAVRDAPRAHYPLGMELFRRGEWRAAIDELQAFLQSEGRMLEAVSARDFMGRAFVQLDQPAAAAEQFRLVLKMSPSAIDAQGELAEVLAAQGQLAEAIAHYRAFLAVRSDDVSALMSLGRTLSRLEKHDEAASAFRRALDIEPSNNLAARNLAIELFIQDDYEGTVAYARQALKSRPDDAIAHDVAGIAFASLSRFDEAISELQRALQLDPANAEIREHLNGVLRSRASRPSR